MSTHVREYHGNGLKQVHRTRVVRYAGFEARVDEKVARLVLALWRAGVYTLSSCQNFDGRVWLVFTTDAALHEFRKLARPRDCEVRSNMIPGMWTLGAVHFVFFPLSELRAVTSRVEKARR